jgi:hypothetical protein
VLKTATRCELHASRNKYSITLMTCICVQREAFGAKLHFLFA